MYRLGALQSFNRKVRGFQYQRGIPSRKRSHLIRLFIIQLTLVALLAGLFVQAPPAHALSGVHDPDLAADHSLSYAATSGKIGADTGPGYAIPYQQVTTTLDVDIISSPWATLDSNDPAGAGGEVPNVFVVQTVITNTGTVSATGVVITLDYEDPVNGWTLVTGEDPVRAVDELAPGTAYHAYWFARYPTTHGVSHQYTVTAEAENASLVATSENYYGGVLNPGETVRTRSTLSTGNSGAVQSVAEIIVGVEFVVIIDYDLGSNPGEAIFSPVGNPDFDSSAYRLLSSEIRFFDSGQNEILAATDRLYFPDLPDSAASARITYTFIALTPANTRLCFYASISVPSPRYDQFYCSADDGTIIPIAGELSLDLTKGVSSQTVQQNQLLSYTISYTNSGDQAVVYAWIWDDLPAGVSVVGSASPPSDPDETTEDRVVWNLDTIPAAGTGTLTFQVLVDGDGQDLLNGTPLFNSAYFGVSPGGLPQRAALTSAVTSTVQAPTISVAKDDGQTIAGPGDLLTYVLTINNSGSIAATGMVITDVLPSDVAVAGTIIPSPTSQVGQTLVWNNVTISPGSNFVATIPVSVAFDVADGTSLINTATVSYQNTAGHIYAEQTATDTTTAWVPELIFTKSAQDLNGTPVVVGDAILYTLRVTNSGNYAAHNVVVTDDLPDQVTCQTVIGNFPPSGCADPLVWTIPTLAPGATVSLYVTVTIDDGAEGQTILNTGSVVGDNVPNPPDDPPPVCPDGSTPDEGGECDVTPAPRDTELAFTKAAQDLNGPPVGIGDAILYTLRVTNIGTYTAYNVVVTDDLHDLVSCQAVSGDSAPAGCADPLIWTIPTMAPGVTATLYITVTIDEGAVGQTILNSGSVVGDNVPNPPEDPTPVCPDGSTPIGGGCPGTPVPGTTLALAKTAEDVDGPPLLVGDTIRYTLLVTNTGAYTASDLTVTDDLPDQVTCQAVSGDSPPPGCADPLVWSIPSLAPDTTARLYVDVTIDRGSEGQSITNTASVVGGNVPDPPVDPPPVCPDGNQPVDGVCENTPGPASGGGTYLPIILNIFQ
jgi:uncharacterized repeat protein (TIGR01451 family)